MTTLKALSLAIGVALATVSAASAWETPARGTQLRTDLMDAMRPFAEWNLGAPVQFVVHDLRVDGDVAFASVTMQRPGGVEIDLTTTPMARRGFYDPHVSDGSTMQVLFQRSGRVWVGVLPEIGATDVWYSSPEFCPQWGRVLPEFCAN